METAERLMDKVNEIQAAVARMEANFTRQSEDYQKAIAVWKSIVDGLNDENETLQRELAQAHMRIEELSK